MSENMKGLNAMISRSSVAANCSTTNKAITVLDAQLKNGSIESNRKFTEEHLINEFFRYFEEYGKYPLSVDLRNNKNFPNISSYTRRYGSWINFLKSLDLVSDDGWYKCDEEILNKYYSNSDYDKINEKLMIKRSKSTIQHKASKMGLKKNYSYKYNREYKSDEELLNNLREFYTKYNKAPKNTEMESSDVYIRRFGSWNNALISAGVPISRVIRKGNHKESTYNGIIADYNSGEKLLEIAERYDYSNGGSIANIISKLQIGEKRNKRWSQTQIQILREKYYNSDWNELLSLLVPFEKEDIITKASKLKISRSEYFWNDEEILFLKEHYGKVSMEEICEKLKTKTYTAIITKANKIGLVSREKWSAEEYEKLLQSYPYLGNDELVALFPNRTKNSIISTARDVLKLAKDESLILRKIEETKQLLLTNLVDFSKELGKTPTIDQINANGKIGGASSYIRYFGSYNEACKLAGLEPNTSLFGMHHTFISKNGDVCLSYPELQITNLFIDNDISYQKEVLYRDIIDDKICGLKRVDWLINNSIVVEFFGMMDKHDYAIRASEKIRLCDDNGVSMISLYPNDLKDNCTSLIKKCSELSIDIKPIAI